MYIEHEPGGCECSCCGAIFIGQTNDFLCKSCQDTAKKEQAMNARQEDAWMKEKYHCGDPYCGDSQGSIRLAFARAIEAEVAAPLEAEIAQQTKEIARLKATIPDIAKRQRECKTLDDWRCLALHYEHSWSQCSYDFNGVAGKQAARIKELEEAKRRGELLAMQLVDLWEESRKQLATANALIEQARKQIVWMLGDHNAPNDCYSTGPLTGTPIDNCCNKVKLLGNC